LDKQKATFCHLGGSGGGAVVTGEAIRLESGRFDLVGMPAVINYLDRLSKELERLGDSSATVGIMQSLERQAEALYAIKETLDDQDPIINVHAAPVDIQIPDISPHVEVTPNITVNVPHTKAILAFLIILSLLFAVMTFAMLDFTYGFTDMIVGTGGREFDSGLSK